ncbi:MAG TPA: suppressor of fused domain protein [Mycobacteriales bacterium]|jgi:hypothetical protein|nr:suppressor of fused domain protein [Mycobacteriales bacterium]
MAILPGDDVLVTVEAHLLSALGQDSGRATVSFVGVDRIDVLRFGPDRDGGVTYATLGMSRRPMVDPAVVAPEVTEGPRAELLLRTAEPQDSVLRSLAVLAATPAVEGLVVRPGATIRLGRPLWEGADVTAVLVGDPAAVPDLDLGDGRGVVRFLSVEPVAG